MTTKKPARDTSLFTDLDRDAQGIVYAPESPKLDRKPSHMLFEGGTVQLPTTHTIRTLGTAGVWP